jgi:putative ABC transport system substrate-binding protein
MKRRNFMTLLGSAAATWPLAARGQRSEKRGVAYLAVGTHASVDENLAALRHALRALGHSGDIEIRYANGDPSQLPSLAAELVGLAPAVIVTGSSIATIAVKRATSTIPIVFTAAADPVKSEFKEKLANLLGAPGGSNLIDGFETIA